MKTKAILSAMVGVSWLVTMPATAQRIEKAEKIVGMKVVDSRGQRVGKVRELAMDLQAGRVALILIDTGGYLTSNYRLVAVHRCSWQFGRRTFP